MPTDQEFDSLLPSAQLDRRGFLVAATAAGFALAVQPVSAQTVISTDTAGLKAGTNSGLIEHGRQHAGIDLAGLTAAGTAIQRGGVGIIGALTAVPYQQDQRRQIMIEAHGVQHPRAQCHLGLDIQTGKLRTAQGPVTCGQAGKVVACA